MMDFHSVESKLKLLRQIYFFFFSPRINYIRRELNKLVNIHFDILLSINANVACKYLFRKLRRENPDLLSILYLWDSTLHYSWIKEFKYFNRIITFDKADSEKYKIEYKPNFYIDFTGDLHSEMQHDLFFIGKYNYSRLLALDQIIALLKKTDVQFCIRLWPSYRIFLHNRFIYNFLKHRWFSGKWIKTYLFNFEAIEGILKRDYFIAENIEYDLIQRQMINANVILDLPLPEQVGYTHRVIEALANGKKIITTNKNICKEPFFNLDQVRIIDPENLLMDFNWIKERSFYTVDSNISCLELSQWLISVLDVKVA